MTWHNILAIISKLTELDEFTVETCANALECKFEHISSNRYRSDTLREPFEYAELISGKDKKLLILTFRVESARDEYAMRMLSLGKPIDIETISPPIADESTSKSNLGWESKYSLCYEIGDHEVWFGIEKAESHKKLVYVSIPGPRF